MKLQRADTAQDWQRAAAMLGKTVERLQALRAPLWSAQQVSAANLQQTYALDELHFLSDDGVTVGLVFLQYHDPDFWPEVAPGDSLFVHKLALLPEHCGKHYGSRALTAIAAHAAAQGLHWLRLDCDERGPLCAFYENNGFEWCDRKRVGTLEVVRYRRRVDAGATHAASHMPPDTAPEPTRS